MTDALQAIVTWQLIVAYLFIGWMVYGLMVFLRAVKPGSERAWLIACLSVWWAALLAELGGRVWKLLGWMAAVAGVVCHPEHGPIARALRALRAWRQHWAGRFDAR